MSRSAWTRRVRQVLALGAASAMLLVAAPVANAIPTPNTDACPYQHTPAPPVDTSEVVPSGQQTPSPLPVPSPAVGGDRLSGCGVVKPDDAAAVPAGITAAGWLVADLDSGKVLLAKDPHGRYRPASTIKVLLALVALDELDVNATVTGTQADYGMEGDSAGMGPGGHYTNRDLLQGLLMVSGNDCANALARELGGYESAVGKMNDKAKHLGAKDTRAASPSGLDAPGMSTSPYDLALIFREAMKNTTFAELAGKTQAHFPGYPKQATVESDKDHPSYLMSTQNQLLHSYPGAIGGKTGFTDDARKTYVGAAARDGHRVLITQLYGFNEVGDSYWSQAAALLDYGFANIAHPGVGELVAPDPNVAKPHDPKDNSAHNAEAPEESSTNWGPRVLYGLIGVLVIVGLVIAATKVNKR